MTVPDIASAVQLEERPRPKAANPYNTLALRKQAQEKKVVAIKPEQLWVPHMQVGIARQESFFDSGKSFLF